jgi:nucleolysin TIA-1/TIAR
LVPYCTQADLIPLFQSIGYLSEIRMQADRGFAFVKLDTHEHAAMAIVQLQGQMVHGRPIKCSWGKDRADGGTTQANPVSPTAAAAPYGNMVCIVNPSGTFNISFDIFSQPMYGMPQPASYGQYGFPGYPGFPGQAATAPGAAGPGSPGMPQAANVPGAGLGLNVGVQQPGAELNTAAAAQPGQPQWGTSDPTYYSNYWGG